MSAFRWVLSAEEAAACINRGATVWDARRQLIWLWKHVAGSQSVQWQAFSQSDPTRRGLLSDRPDSQAEILQKLGVDRDRPVIVVGNPQSPWGEEGRLVWTLRSLGHERAAWVDGGWTALRSRVPLRRGSESNPKPGAFSPQLDSTWTATCEDVRSIANNSNSEWVLLDTRSPREFAGATPYGESRGGRIPGAKSFPLQKLRQEDGFLRSPE
ncbi:MAG: rhodanese-like domain-containing protein, partial [Cyanobacteria bacterium J06648_11]